MTTAIYDEIIRIIESGWCQSASARDAAGVPTTPEADEACSWCLTGAIALATRGGIEATDAVLDGIEATLDTISIERWNDEPGRTAEDVVTVLRETAERGGPIKDWDAVEWDTTVRAYLRRQ